MGECMEGLTCIILEDGIPVVGRIHAHVCYISSGMCIIGGN